MRLNNSLAVNYSESSPLYREQFKNIYDRTSFNKMDDNQNTYNSQDKWNTFDGMDNRNTVNSLDDENSLINSVETVENRIFPPPPPSHFLGYTLPPGHPCNSFTLPPPPVDKKRTGPRRKFLSDNLCTCFISFFGFCIVS